MVLFGFTVALAALATSVIASPTTTPALVNDINSIESLTRSLNGSLDVFFKSPNEVSFESVLTTGLEIHSGIVTATNDAGHAISETDGAAIVVALQGSAAVVSSTLDYLTASYSVIENDTTYVENIAKSLVVLVTDITRFSIVLAANIPCDLRATLETVAETYLQAFALALDAYV